jgi:rod shape-determining protein MreD
MGGGCQRAVSPYIAIGGVAPDFLLVVIGCLALFGTRRSGSIIGFLAGVIEGALAGANLAAYAVSRTIAGFVSGWFSALEFEAGAIVASFVVFAITLLSQLLLMFVAPPGQIGGFLLATIGSAVYNGVLAMPLYALLRRVLDPPAR